MVNDPKNGRSAQWGAGVVVMIAFEVTVSHQLFRAGIVENVNDLDDNTLDAEVAPAL